MFLKVIGVNKFDAQGGAARAAYRIHCALRTHGIDVRLWVDKSELGDRTVESPSSAQEVWLTRLRNLVGRQLTRTLLSENPVLHSHGSLPSRWVPRLNQSDADIVHLHWFAFEMLSIAELGRIRKPLVWTLHDMWAFCGAEHYTSDGRWRAGYRADNRPAGESGFDLNRWTWQRKRKHWRRPIHLIAPSRWLADCVQQSALLRDWPVTVIPNTLNTDFWKPMEAHAARQQLGLPLDVPMLLFGAIHGGQDPRKGLDLLLDALTHLRDDPRAHGLQVVVFGQRSPKVPFDVGFPMHYMGHVHDDQRLRALYNAVDALVVPSRQDNLPNTGVEAHACGTPVVGFDVGGLSDIIRHETTGYLAAPFDTVSLANGILWTLQSDRQVLSAATRQRALQCFSPPVVAAKYLEVFQSVLAFK